MSKRTVETSSLALAARGLLGRRAQVWQWLVVAIVGLFALSLRMNIYQLSAPNAPLILFWSTMAIGMVIAAAHMPPAFFRLPRFAKVMAYLCIPTYVVLYGFALGQVGEAWERTPKGAAEAKQAEIDRQNELKEEAESRRLDAELATAAKEQERAGKLIAQLQRCFPVSQATVRSSLHNPHAFELVDTTAIESDFRGRNVAMTFRGENGFGALRTWVIKAKIDPSDCRVLDIGEPEQA